MCVHFRLKNLFSFFFSYSHILRYISSTSTTTQKWWFLGLSSPLPLSSLGLSSTCAVISKSYHQINHWLLLNTCCLPLSSCRGVQSINHKCMIDTSNLTHKLDDLVKLGRGYGSMGNKSGKGWDVSAFYT